MANQSLGDHVFDGMIRVIRPILRFRLRTLLFGLVVVGVFSGLLGQVLRSHQAEQAVLAKIPKLVADTPISPIPVFT